MSTIKCSEIDDSGRGTWHVIYQSNGEDYLRHDFHRSINDSDSAQTRALELFCLTADSYAQKIVNSYKLERW